MIEFAFILPIFMFLLLFTIDMGQVILMSGAMQDATFSAARAGAQVGGASVDARTGTTVCGRTGACSSGSTYRTFARAADQIPFAATKSATKLSIRSGGVCTTTGADSHVGIDVTYNVRLLTPGLNSMLGLMNGTNGGKDADWAMKATAVARCEIVR